MNEKLTGIPETLLIALWARANATRQQHPIINDTKAVEMVREIDYDFSRFENSGRLTTLGVAIRTMILDRELSNLLEKHPDAVVINLGAGLDTRHTRMGCDSVDWHEIDLPESIELRARFFSETDHYHFIAQSMLDMSWIEKIQTAERPVIFLAEGLFMYFDETELKPFFSTLAETFSGAEMLFEMLCPIMVGRAKHHETLKKIDSAPAFKWGLKNTRDMEAWHPGIHIVDEWNYYDEHKGAGGSSVCLGACRFYDPVWRAGSYTCVLMTNGKRRHDTFFMEHVHSANRHESLFDN